MIPLIAIVSVRHPKGCVRVWAPLFLAWLVLAPLAVLLAPFALLACAVTGVNPVRMTGAALAVLTGLSGLLVEVESPAARVLVRIH
jgi:hypothetical protein